MDKDRRKMEVGSGDGRLEIRDLAQQRAEELIIWELGLGEYQEMSSSLKKPWHDTFNIMMMLMVLDFEVINELSFHCV